MKNKKKRLICTFTLAALLTCTVPATFVQAATAPTVEPKTYIKEWRYKVIGNHFYKRLYNCSTGEWETDWILVA